MPNFATPELVGKQLRLKAHAKYIGVILDWKLQWKANTEDRVQKSQ